VTVKYATKTPGWDRTFFAKPVQDHFKSAVEKAKLPPGKTTVTMT